MPQSPAVVKASLAQGQTQFSAARIGAQPAWGEVFEFAVVDETAQTLDFSLMNEGQGGS